VVVKPLFALKTQSAPPAAARGGDLGERKIGFFAKIQFFSPLKPQIVIKPT